MSLRVIQILPSLDSGGVEQVVLNIAKHLVETGHHSTVISSGGIMVDGLVQGGTEHIDLPIGKKSLLLVRYIPYLRKIFSRADIIDVHSRFPAWLSYFAWRGMVAETRPGWITSCHGAYHVNRYSAIMTKGQRIIAASEYIRDYMVSHFPHSDRNRIITIPRGVDPDRYNNQFTPGDSWLRNWHQLYPSLKNKFIITLPGRITRLKGHEEFLKIIDILIKKGLNVHGLIAGGYHSSRKKYFNHLKELCQSLGLSQHITFTGQRGDLREIMSISDIVFSLTRNPPEGFGMTTLEALCLGTPVIAYNLGGVREILQTLFPDGLVEPGKTEEIIARVEKYYDRKPAVTGSNPYVLQKMLDRTIECYQELHQELISR